MSDSKNLSDYNKPRTDLNKLLPEFNLKDAKILRGFNENLFNRFFTKDQVKRIVGIIGSDDFTTEDVNQILEPTEFRQANQLQPIVYNKVGNIDWFMSFEDFMNRLSLLGVDINKFDEWGNSLQFNWIPPIDIDKLINYQDYFWNSTGFDDPPQYITIKDQCQWVTSRQTQILKGISITMPTYEIVGYDDVGVNEVWVDGNHVSTLRVGELLILTGSSLTPVTATVVSTFYNVGNDRTEIEVSGFTVTIGVTDIYSALSETEIAVVSTNNALKTITVSSDVSDLFGVGYIFSAEESATSQPMKLFSVVGVVFDAIANQTTITTNEELGNVEESTNFDWVIITAKPLVRSVDSEFNVVCNAPFSRTNFGAFDESLIGDIIWTKFIQIITPRTTGGSEGTTLGSVLFTDTDGAKDFLTDGVILEDLLRISGTGFDGDFPISNIVTSDILSLNDTFFTQISIDYEIVRPRLLTDIESLTAPVGIEVNQLWYDTTNNQLRQWDGALWNVVVVNFSLLVDVNNNAHLIDLDQNNDWVDQNNWIHRTEVNNFTGKSRAQQPIIEYFPYIKLSEHSFADKEWRYRRDDAVSYAVTTIEPTLFELIDTRVINGGEVSFQNDTTLLFDNKFGNLTSALTEGVEIQLGDFGANTGTNTVVSSEFVQLAPFKRFRTRVILLNEVSDPLDVPLGAFVAPSLTSLGDAWVSFDTFHWQLEGIDNITASSIEPTINPMLDEVIGTSISGSITSILGLYSQTFKRVAGSGSILGATYTLDNSLHDLALYEDFQEGDVRVYINDRRQYGNFIDFQSVLNPEFVGGIIFNPDVEVTDNDVVRIELGEYALNDIGKRNVLVNTVSGIEKFNLVDLRRLEQIKSERSQYPFFNTYNVNFEPFRFATEIFRYQDDVDGDYFPDIDQRIFFDAESQDYRFEQKLKDSETDELYVYFDGREFEDEFQSIWKKGLNNEQFVPVEINDFWSFPNQLYYNVNHENRETIKLTEVFRHFNTIILEQLSPGIVSSSFTNVYHLDNVVNYGLGGRIKEHNDGFDTLLSAIFVNNVNPVDLIRFAGDRYDNNEIIFKEILTDNIIEYLNKPDIADITDLTDFISEEIQDTFEKDDRLDQWFGDSTTFNEATNIGVKNHIATIPYLGLLPKVQPYLLIDEDFLQLIHHDGHRSDIKFNPATLEAYYRLVLLGTNSDTQVVNVDAEAFPALINGSPPALGDLLVRTVTSEMIRKLYRFGATNEWELLDISVLFAKILLNIEESLFEKLGPEALPSNFIPRFDFTVVQDNADYTIKIQEQFSMFVRDRNILSPFINTQYVQNDPFTWNYAFTPVRNDPITGERRSDVRASWQALYTVVYNTPYPNLEPWALQGYLSKPLFWDAQYVDTTETRKWLPIMWSNILSGTVAMGTTAPDGNMGTGLPNQILPLFSYIPVNIEDTDTIDGFAPDAILPPFWNSDNSPNPAVRSLHDAALQEFIVTPNANYEFGQQGPDEWLWDVSLERLYDELIVAFKIEPPKFLNQSMGPELIDVACLQVDDRVNKVASHQNIKFHGDVTSVNSIVQVDGLNQWYIHFNRYNGFDGISSEFRQMWKDWEALLTYQFASFIDIQNFKISSDKFDVTTNDFDIIFQKTQGIRDIWLDGLEASLISTPSKFASDTEAGLEWTVSFNNTSPVGRPIISFGVQNYPVRVFAGLPTFKTFSFRLSAAEVQESVGFDIVQYSETLAPEVATELNNDSTLYFASVLFNNVDTVNLSIQGDKAQTFGDLVDQINLQLGSDGNAFLEDGNFVIESGLTGGTTETVITDGGLFATASSFFLGTTGNNIALISFKKGFFVSDNVVSFFPVGSTFDIVDSTNFNGEYTVVSSIYSPTDGTTRIEVEEETVISDITIDGFLEPSNAITLPDEWVTGIGLHWGGNGTIPSPFDTTSLFFMIRINDREFQLALTREAALDGEAIDAENIGENQQYIGRVKNTFTAFSAREVLIHWKQHVVDDRVIKTFATPITLSGVQNMIDFINGYDGHLQSIGFLFEDFDGSNRDLITGRENDWQFETEKFIEFLYASRNIQQEERQQFLVIPDAAGNTFASTDVIQWITGTRVTIDTLSGGTLPAEFDSPIASSIPYFIIQTVTVGRVQLAASPSNASKGIPITFSDDGSGDIVLRVTPKITSFPKHEINPQQTSVFINHDTGIVSDIFAGSNLDLLTDQRVYDTDKKNLTIDDIVISRKDLRTQIELSNQRIAANKAGLVNSRIIGGMHIFFDGFEHISQFPNYSCDGTLIYDPFLGINTPRFFLEFDRQTEFTLRPNIGGSVLRDQEQVQNIESAIESLRFAYSTYRSKEGNKITLKVREALGYDGPFDFADDIGITNKSQFILYRGLIQRKGTNFAANAFTNQLIYDDVDIDEFWTYRLACFGDSKEKIYPELKLFSSDITRKELRLEFVPLLGTASDSSFEAVDLSNDDRWFDRPDQAEKLEPRDRFYINAKVQERFEDIIRTPEYFVANGDEYLQLSKPADAAFVNRLAETTPRQFLQLTEGANYEFVTKTLIKFIGNITPASFELNVSTLVYSYDAQNPAKIINRRDGRVVTEVPIWNPARQEYYSKAIYGVNFRSEDRLVNQLATIITSPITGNETGYIGVGDNGSFNGGTGGYRIGDNIVLSNGASLIVDNLTNTVLRGEQDQINYDSDPVTEGSFTGGSGYVTGEIITLSDGTIITVLTVDVDVITEFNVTTPSGAVVTPSVALTQSSTTGIGAGFTLTPELGNLEGEVIEFTVNTPGGNAVSGTEQTQFSTTLVDGVTAGNGLGFTLTPGAANIDQIKESDDPARYNVKADSTEEEDLNFWDSRFDDKVWFYAGSEGYRPFDDKNVETDSNERFNNWGRLSDWGEIEVFQWTASDVLPSEYDALASQAETEAILPINARKTGLTRKITYRNDGTSATPIWVKEEDQHYDFVKDIVESSTYPTVLFEKEVELYEDALFSSTETFANASEFESFVSGLTGTLIHVIDRAVVPTKQQIDDMEYKLDTPFSVVNRINPISGNEEFTYFFWVEDRLSAIPILGGPQGSITLKTIKEGLQTIPTPFMIPNNIVDLTLTSFADLFITNSPRTEDTLSYEFPFAYNQVVVKGMSGTVQADDAYTLRFTRDFALRDRLAAPDKAYQLIISQDETDFSLDAGEGTFFGGTGHVALDVITLSNGTTSPATEGATVRVDTVVSGVVTELTILTVGNLFDLGDTLTQISTTGGGDDFTLTPEIINVTERLKSGISDLQLKNIHWEWKLFREKQFAKIDRILWDAITESILGFEFDGDPIDDIIITPTPSPSLSSSPTPTPVAVSQTPDVTPTLTPNVTPTPTLTPSVTPTISLAPSPTPDVTPTLTPVASPTPSPAAMLGLFLESGTPYLGTISASDFSLIPASAVASFQFRPKTASIFPNRVIRTGASNLVWLFPPDIGDSSLYEIKVDVISGTLDSPSEPTGVWLDLSSARIWTLSRDVLGVEEASGTVTIRDKATMTTQLIRGFLLTVTVDFDVGDIEGTEGNQPGF